MGFLDYVIAFVFVLGVMVLVHELGHFLAARYFGVRVEAFAFGFGPRLLVTSAVTRITRCAWFLLAATSKWPAKPPRNQPATRRNFSPSRDGRG